MENVINLTLKSVSLIYEERFGVYNPEKNDMTKIKCILTFFEPPSNDGIQTRAEALANIAGRYGARHALIDVPQFMVSAVEKSLLAAGIEPVYSYDGGAIIRPCNEKHSTVYRTKEVSNEV